MGSRELLDELDGNTKDTIAKALWMREFDAERISTILLGHLVSDKNINKSFKSRCGIGYRFCNVNVRSFAFRVKIVDRSVNKLIKSLYNQKDHHVAVSSSKVPSCESEPEGVSDVHDISANSIAMIVAYGSTT
jgi:hypothetical protein